MSDNSLPLAPATFLVLFALAGGDRHGYGIMQDVRKLDASFQLGPATLYTTIQRLLDNGLISEVSGPESGERRRHMGLVLEDIEAGAGDSPRRKRLRQRRLVDDGAARGVRSGRSRRWRRWPPFPSGRTDG